MKKPADKKPAPRRAPQFWAPFNAMLREHMAKHDGLKPSLDALVEWYNENADLLWGDNKPKFSEARHHARSVRSAVELRDYFREYRSKIRGEDPASDSLIGEGRGSPSTTRAYTEPAPASGPVEAFGASSRASSSQDPFGSLPSGTSADGPNADCRILRRGSAPGFLQTPTANPRAKPAHQLGPVMMDLLSGINRLAAHPPSSAMQAHFSGPFAASRCMSLPLQQVTTGFSPSAARPSHSEDVAPRSLAAPLHVNPEALPLTLTEGASVIPMSMKPQTFESISGSSSGHLASASLLGGERGLPTPSQMQPEQHQHQMPSKPYRHASEDGRGRVTPLPPMHAYRRLPSFPAWGFFASIPENVTDSGAAAGATFANETETEPNSPNPTPRAQHGSRHYLPSLSSRDMTEHLPSVATASRQQPQPQPQPQLGPHGSELATAPSAPEAHLQGPLSSSQMDGWTMDWPDTAFDRLSDPREAAGLRGAGVGLAADEEAVLALLDSWDSQEDPIAF